MAFMQIAAESAFEIQFPGENLPFTLHPGNGNIGAIMKDWASDEDKEFFSDMYPRLRPGLVVASINGVATTILDYEAVTKLMSEAKDPRHVLFVERRSKWDIVRARLSYIANNMSKQRGGTSKEAQELSRRAHEALLLYIRQGNQKYIRKQLSQITNIDFQKPPTLVCALHLAVGKQNIDLVDELIHKRGADLYLADINGVTSLMIAAGSNYLAIAKLLLNHVNVKYGDLIHARDNEHRNALHFASRNGHLRMVKLLLNYGAIPNRVTKRKLTALHMAAIGVM